MSPFTVQMDHREPKQSRGISAMSFSKEPLVSLQNANEEELLFPLSESSVIEIPSPDTGEPQRENRAMDTLPKPNSFGELAQHTSFTRESGVQCTIEQRLLLEAIHYVEARLLQLGLRELLGESLGGDDLETNPSVTDQRQPTE